MKQVGLDALAAKARLALAGEVLDVMLAILSEDKIEAAAGRLDVARQPLAVSRECPHHERDIGAGAPAL